MFPTTIPAEIIIASDIHIMDRQDPSCDRLLRLVAAIDSERTSAFVLAGDIFHLFFGGSRYFDAKFKDIKSALGRLAESGVDVFLIQGNHEFALPRLQWPGVKVVTHSVTLELSNGERIAICHGDLIAPPLAYQAYLSLVRHPLVYRSALALIPNKLIDDLGLWCANSSKNHGMGRQLHVSRVARRAAEWIAREGVTRGVIGHYHYPFYHSYNGRTVMGMPCWDRANALCIDPQTVNRLFIGDERFTLKPLHDPIVVSDQSDDTIIASDVNHK